MEISIRDMKNGLSKYLKLVKAGRNITITDRGKPVARLTRAELTAEEKEAEYIRYIRSLPWVRAGDGRPGREIGPRKPIRLKGKGIRPSQQLLKDRR